MKNYIKCFLLLTASASTIASATECKPIGHTDGESHNISAMTNYFTHIVLPENIIQGTKPIVGNKDLWVVDSAGPHIYIKPTSKLKPGESTSLSAVGESKKSYDFKVFRKEKIDTTCVQLVEGVLFSASQKKALMKQPDTTSSELASLWREKYTSEKRSKEKAVKEAVFEALRRYRYQIYTRYKWGKGSGFIGKKLISDVYDDGRFTYIRVYNQNKGLLMVEAKLAGETEIVEAKFDTLNKMYTISGIFPEFTLKYGDSKLKVSRADNSTAGEY